jgi:hypothetical protein
MRRRVQATVGDSAGGRSTSEDGCWGWGLVSITATLNPALVHININGLICVEVERVVSGVPAI